ncbi:MAG: hypothetical protein Q6366_007035 [Candidatus Freyarchaeota archaeon]
MISREQMIQAQQPPAGEEENLVGDGDQGPPQFQLRFLVGMPPHFKDNLVNCCTNIILFP